MDANRKPRQKSLQLMACLCRSYKMLTSLAEETKREEAVYSIWSFGEEKRREEKGEWSRRGSEGLHRTKCQWGCDISGGVVLIQVNEISASLEEKILARHLIVQVEAMRVGEGTMYLGREKINDTTFPDV